MEAGTATVINPRVKLRQQLMNDGVDMSQLDEPAHQRQGNQYMGPTGANNMNYDYGVMNNGAGSRKASLTSQSGMQRFFRRNKSGGNGVGFDDDVGADMLDMTSAINMSIEDLSHIKDRGRYGINNMALLDTTPLIPVLGGGASTSNKVPVSSVEYRKQMNYHKKLAMSMSSQSRANTMSGPNPMGPQMNGVDGRTMSLNTYGQGPRMMSLNSNSVAPNGPRTMSLNNRMQMNGMAPNQPYDPRAMSLNNRMPPGGNYMGHPMDPRAMSMRGMGHPNQNMQPMIPNGMGPGPGPRTMSLNNQPNFHPGNKVYPQGNPQVNPQGNYHVNYQANPSHNPSQYQQNLQNGGLQQPYGNNLAPQRGFNESAIQQNSNDSIMNVVEEEEDQLIDEEQHSDTKVGSKENLNSQELNEEDDVVYNLDKESEGLSRSTTLMKSNSMKLRKLDLFDKTENKNEDEETEGEVIPGSPTFNIKDTFGNRESIIADEFDSSRRKENKEKFRSIGANATANNSNGSVLTKDVFTTASDFISPVKSNKSVKSTNLNNLDARSENETTISDEDNTIDNEEEYNIQNEKNRGSPLNGAAIKKLNKKDSFKSIVENTAYNNFRASNYDLHKVSMGNQKEMKTSQSDSNIELNSSKENNSIRNFSLGPSLTEETADDVEQVESNNQSESLKFSSTSSNSVSDGRYEKRTVFTKSELNPSTDNSSFNSQSEKKEQSISKSFSFSGKSKNFLKKLSKSKRNSTPVINDESFNSPVIELRNNSMTSRRTSYSTKLQQPIQKQQVSLTKEELGIMTCNNDLLNELQLVTVELASSIKRELELESKLSKSPSSSTFEEDPSNSVLEKVKIIAELQEKLNKERKLRFISEEHALLMENGQSPSAIKLGYENAELYNQLLIKNDLINQLQHKLKEAEEKAPEPDKNLLHNYNELLKENTNFKLNIIPELKNQLAHANENHQRYSSTSARQLSLATGTSDNSHEHVEEEIANLKSQRDELRETIQQLTSKHNYEARLANDKIKALETKLNNMSNINSKLSKRVDSENFEVSTGQTNSAINNRGGKLQGFNVITSTKSFYNE